jgi:hypothetical protein
MAVRNAPLAKASDVEKRDVHALTECMTVDPDAPQVADDAERFEVTSTHTYVVNLRVPACDCPDCLHRGVRCKHIRRVLFATGRKPIPAWVANREAIDPWLGQLVDGDLRFEGDDDA